MPPQKVSNGSLSCNSLTFSTSFQSVLRAQKQIKLEEKVGKRQEKEEVPGGELLQGPVGK